MRIKITRATVVKDMGIINVGKTVTVDETTAAELFRLNKAVPVADAPKKATMTKAPKAKKVK